MKIPSGEILWVQYMNNGLVTHIITSKPDRSLYYLYQVSNDKLTKLGKAKEPTELEERFIEQKRARARKAE